MTPPPNEQVEAVAQTKRISGYCDYIDDPDGLERFRSGVFEARDRHDMAPVNFNSLARLIDTIERLRSERDAAIAAMPARPAAEVVLAKIMNRHASRVMFHETALADEAWAILAALHPPASNASGAGALLREQHEAMADVMELRRLSSNSEQRAKAERAIAVWRRVEAYLAGNPPADPPASGAAAMVNPMPDPEINWLVHQLEAWPSRVHPERTCNLEYLLQTAARVIRNLPLPASDANKHRDLCLTGERPANPQKTDVSGVQLASDALVVPRGVVENALTAFAEGVEWTNDQRAAYEALHLATVAGERK